ncbi:MAG TPA: hypothetical protein PKA05_07415 [Roseiflexaceae bacterium]|nr:hypothetical protein [Roseiflexaceae bacterium]HMP40191.1 hypothetical protein [Roseiflexaceae bacterium]
MSLIAGNLSAIQRILDGDQIEWAVCAGAAAHLYGTRRPIRDVDILVAPGALAAIARLLNQQQKTVQFDGRRILWRGIELIDDLSVRRNGMIFPLTFDPPMRERLRRMPLLGAPVAVQPPEDVVLHKLLLDRGAAEGKHDHDDALGIVRRQQLDAAYLKRRMQLMRFEATAALAAIGVVLSDS